MVPMVQKSNQLQRSIKKIQAMKERGLSYQQIADILNLWGIQKITNVGWRSVYSIARRKLDMLHYSHTLLDLRSPPGNRLEELKGNLKGFYSIRINDQWRVVFQWTSQGPTKVDIIDYH